MKNLAFLAVSLLLVLPLSAAETTVAGLVEQYEHPTLGASKSVENMTFISGHLRVTLTQGSAAPVMAGDETLGLFFKGKGQFEYISDDPAEAAVMTTNLKKGTRLNPDKSGNGIAVRDNFEEVFIWTAGRELPALTSTAAGADLAPAFAAHRETFGNEQGTNASFAFVKQKLDHPKKELVRAQFRGGKETLVYTFDSFDAKRETLSSLHRIPGMDVRELKQGLWPVELSSLPIGISRRDFVEPQFILSNLQYTLTASAKNDAALTAIETLIPRGTAQRVFRFNQHSTVWADRTSARHYNVRKATTADGKELSFVHEHGELLVGLPAAAPADKPFKVTFEIDGDFLIRPSGDSYWLLGIEPWFPQPSLSGQYYTAQSTVKVKKPFVPLTPGETVSRREEGDYNVVESKIDKPVQYLIAMAGKYSFEEETRNGLKIRVASYAGKNTRAMKQLTSLAFTMIEFYEKFLGPFPFREYNIIELNDFGYGQAPPATMFITKEAFNPLLGWQNQIFSQGVNHRFAHEIAHQYWGHVVKMGSVEEQWITEAFAEYSSSFIVKQMKGDVLTATWRANAGDATKASSIVMANRLADYGDPWSAFLTRTHLIYDKGAYVLGQLHKEMGDKHFLTFLRTFQGVYAWKFGLTKDMPVVLKNITGKDYAPYFEEHVWGTAMPK
jgi:hypothetical protein